jgi:hypothetical protein
VWVENIAREDAQVDDVECKLYRMEYPAESFSIVRPSRNAT